MHTTIFLSLKKFFEQLRVEIYIFFCAFSIRRLFFLRKVKKKPLINVVFFASNLSMWRYQHLYELMNKNNRFKTYIVLVPFLNYSKKQQSKDLDELKIFFDSKKIISVR